MLNEQHNQFRRPTIKTLLGACLLSICLTVFYVNIAWSLPQPDDPNIIVSQAPVEEIPSNPKLTARDAKVINIGDAFTRDSLQAALRHIDRALEQDAKTIIFRFSGRGRSFESFSDLGRRIVRLAQKEKVHTVAFIPKQAKGMTMLAIFACRQIIADEFAQLGQVITPSIPRGDDIPRSKIDTQSVVNKITGFAQAAGHNPLLAQAMARKHMILYEIVRNGEKKLVDQPGFELHLQQTDPPWRLSGTAPIVSSDQVLLLSGREALNLGLITNLAADEEELAQVLNVNLTPVSLTDKKSTKITKKIPYSRLFEPIPIDEPNKPDKAIFIDCSEMVDEGLYESIKRRTKTALADGATYIIYELDTFGGRVDSAIAIHTYILNEVSRKAHTVAYVRTKAISAGALISVACQDIIMKANSQLGDCAPISMGGKLEGVEREKMESPLRSYFAAAAKANGYPVALCKAMVTIAIEVFQVKNLQTDEYEYFERNDLPRDSYIYDLEGKRLILTKENLLTIDADLALEYGLARAVVEGLDDQARLELLAFLSDRDEVNLTGPIEFLKTNWSEELVRWLTSPAVSGILLMVAMLGIYAELNSPGLGLPGAIAVVALIVLFGSKFLIGLANWWEIGLFFVGFVLLTMEIFVIPGFGIAGIAGIFCMMFSLGAMMVGNRPDELPIPVSPIDWDIFQKNLFGMIGGICGFLLGASLLGRYLPSIPIANKLILTGPQESAQIRSGGHPAPAPPPTVQVGQQGISLSPLRPSGIARFATQRVNVVTKGELIETKQTIKIVQIVGNSIVVKEV